MQRRRLRAPSDDDEVVTSSSLFSSPQFTTRSTATTTLCLDQTRSNTPIQYTSFHSYQIGKIQMVTENVLADTRYVDLCKALADAHEDSSDEEISSTSICLNVIIDLEHKQWTSMQQKLKQKEEEGDVGVNRAKRALAAYRRQRRTEHAVLEEEEEERVQEEKERHREAVAEEQAERREEEKTSALLQAKKDQAAHEKAHAVRAGEALALQQKAQAERAAVALAAETALKVETARKKKEVAAARRLAKEAAEVHLVGYRKRMIVLQQHEDILKPVLESTDPNTKRIRMQVKLQVGEACIQISAQQSVIQLQVEKLCKLLDDAKASGENYHIFAMYLIAQKLIARIRVYIMHEECFAMGHVIMMLCVHTPSLTNVIVGHLNKACLYTVPHFLMKSSSQSMEEYQKTLGFEIVDESSGKLEYFKSFAHRMSMGVAIYAAAAQTTPWGNQPQPEGLSLQDLWQWLHKVLETPPQNMTPILLLTMLEVAGFELSRVYQADFHTMLESIMTNTLPAIFQVAKTGDARVAAVGLQTFLTKYGENSCRFVEPTGRELHDSTLSAADEESESKGGYHGDRKDDNRDNYQGRNDNYQGNSRNHHGGNSNYQGNNYNSNYQGNNHSSGGTQFGSGSRGRGRGRGRGSNRNNRR